MISTAGSPLPITQSLIKAIKSCTDENPTECALVIKAKFVDGRFDLFPPSDAQHLGTWFEYKCTGAIPKNGKVPEPVRINKGKELAAPYRLMEKHVQNFKNLLKFYGLKIISAGADMEADGLKGTTDLLLEATRDIYQTEGKESILIVKKGQKIIGDMKSTGLLGDRDKWNAYSWNIDLLHTKFNLVLQPVHYKMIARHPDVFGEDLPFWFFLFNTNDENDYRIIDFRVNEYDYEVHAKLVANTVQWLQWLFKNGFEKKANPSVERCAVCPIKVGCKHFAVAPKILVYHLSQKQDNSEKE